MFDDLKTFIGEQVVIVDDAARRIGTRAPWVKSPTAHRTRNLAAEAAGATQRLEEVLVRDLRNVVEDIRHRATTTTGEWQQLLTDLADSLQLLDASTSAYGGRGGKRAGRAAAHSGYELRSVASRQHPRKARHLVQVARQGPPVLDGGPASARCERRSLSTACDVTMATETEFIVIVLGVDTGDVPLHPVLLRSTPVALVSVCCGSVPSRTSLARDRRGPAAVPRNGAAVHRPAAGRRLRQVHAFDQFQENLGISSSLLTKSRLKRLVATGLLERQYQIAHVLVRPHRARPLAPSGRRRPRRLGQRPSRPRPAQHGARRRRDRDRSRTRGR